MNTDRPNDPSATALGTAGWIKPWSAINGGDCLEVCGGGEARLTCDHLTLKVAGQRALKATAAGKQVSISSPSLKAKADSISLANGEDRLILEGHVRLEYRLDSDEHGEVTAGRVVINLAEGQLEIKPSAGPTPPHAAKRRSDI